MKIAVLGSTGRTGRLLVARSLARGHDVVALARRPEQVGPHPAGSLRVARADVGDPGSVRAAVEGADVVLSGLGVTGKQDPAILVDGAREVASAGVRVIWLASLGMGGTEGALGAVGGALVRRVLRREWDAKRISGRTVREAGGTAVHAGPLTDRPYRGGGRLLRAGAFGPRAIPPRASREGVAALMVAEAETPCFVDEDTVALFDGR
ncbi:NAD(P)-dependent oxidoreductase [Streptomyces sp. NPDC048481]|uniref:NAD(P)-dependent oxidoreductase n=1 Tax=Streptomyces sp. NPDC048481 TaxID=3365557 RepID=UPI00371C2882